MKKKFTLLELMIIIAIIGILLTLLLPSLGKTRERAKRAICLSNQQQVYRGQIHFASKSNGKFAASDNGTARYFKARDIDKMNLYETPSLWQCPNWNFDTNASIFDLTDAQRKNKLNNNNTVMIAYHMLTGKDIHNEFGGSKGWVAYESAHGEQQEIPMIADRTASPKFPFRTKVMHSASGGQLVEVNYILDIGKYGCEGQNETAFGGSGRWVYINSLVSHNIKPDLRGFWSRDY